MAHAPGAWVADARGTRHAGLPQPAVCLAHPTGNTFVRAAVRALHEVGWLRCFFTTVASPASSALEWLPGHVRNQALRRRFAEIPPDRIRTSPWPELLRLAAEAFSVSALTRPGAYASVDAVYERFDRHVASEIDRQPSTACDVVYAYEDGAEQTLLAAKRRGATTVYELPIAYWEVTQRLLHEEADRLPAWRPTLRGLEDSDEKLARKSRELELAETVIVPSRFVLNSLPAGVRQTKRCLVAPFGSPAPVDDESAAAVRAPSAGRPLRVLFVGAMTQRKGLADLFAAMRLLNRRDIELIVMGSRLAPMSFYRREYPDFAYEPPRPHADVLALMRTCDVLVLPAIVEGRALVQQEALSCGLPLVTTLNAGADDLVEEGRTGFLVPIRSPHAVAQRLAWFADNRAQLQEMRRHARRKAAATGWADYMARVRDAVQPKAIAHV